MKERKYTLTVTESQLRLIADCVEDCHRFAAGQMDLWNVTSYLRSEDARHIRERLGTLQPLMTGGREYSWDGEGCPIPSQRKLIAATYTIYREIIHRLTVLNEKSAGWSVYQNETLTCDEGGSLPKVELIKEEEK